MTSEEKRIKFHNKLKEIIGDNVYYNPPQSTSLKYPCIIYSLKDIRVRKASDKVYLFDHVYQVTLIGVKPYEDYKDRMVIEFPYSKFDRTYISDGLYHYVYTIYENIGGINNV